MIDWPPNYDPTTHTSPSLSPEKCLELGASLALRLVTDADFCAAYLILVKQFYRERTIDNTFEYAKLISRADPGHVDPHSLNWHDFANIHRAAWLKLVHSLARLVALNPFASTQNDNPWANPRPDGSTERYVSILTAHGRFFFEIPNAKGYYALTHVQFEHFERIDLGELLPESLFLP